MGDRMAALRPRLRPEPEGRALAGLSGGADSVALLYLLLPLRDAGKLQIEAVHVNHGIRGAEADADEAFCRELCAREGIPFHARRVDLGGRTDENGAREARYACFAACMRETGIRQLILAHQRDDQAETFLMRLLRGAGPEGLGCMRAAEERDGYTLIRPMLEIGGEELRNALREAGIPWREDGTNAGDGYLRNRVRHGLLPEMERLAPGAAERIARAARLIREEYDALVREAGDAEKDERDWIAAEELAGMDRAARRERMRRWWRRRGPKLDERALSWEQAEALAGLADAAPGSSVNLPAGWRAERGQRHLHLVAPQTVMPDPVPWREPGIAFGEFELAGGPSLGNPGDGKRSQEVPAGFAAGCEVRTRRNGDRIRPFGMAGSKALQDYFTDRKIDRAWRDRIPLLCRGNEVLWAAGVGAGAVPPWREDGENIRLTWQGGMPWEQKEAKHDRKGREDLRGPGEDSGNQGTDCRADS